MIEDLVNINDYNTRIQLFFKKLKITQFALKLQNKNFLTEKQ